MADFEPSLQQLLANQSPRQSSGWGAVGSALGQAFRGPGDDMANPYFQQGAYKGAQTAKVLQEARQAQEQGVAREAEAARQEGLGNIEAAAHIRGYGGNISEAANASATDLTSMLRRQADAMPHPGFTDFGAKMIVAQNKYENPSEIKDGTWFTPGLLPGTSAPASNAGTPHSNVRFNFAPGTPPEVIAAAHAAAQADGDEDPPSLQSGMGLPQGRQQDPSEIGQMLTTPIGQSTIGANNARASDSYAAAAEHGQQGHLADVRAADVGKGGSKRTAEFSAPELSLLFSKPVLNDKGLQDTGTNGQPLKVFDKDAFNQYNDYHAQHHGSASDDLAAWRAQQKSTANVGAQLPGSGMAMDLLHAFTGGGPSTVTGATQMPPASAFQGLAPGAARKFSNGQTWTLGPNGPVQVK